MNIPGLISARVSCLKPTSLRNLEFRGILILTIGGKTGSY